MFSRNSSRGVAAGAVARFGGSVFAVIARFGGSVFGVNRALRRKRFRYSRPVTMLTPHFHANQLAVERHSHTRYPSRRKELGDEPFELRFTLDPTARRMATTQFVISRIEEGGGARNRLDTGAGFDCPGLGTSRRGDDQRSQGPPRSRRNDAILDLGRPVVDRITGSRHHNMKELRASQGGALRVLLMFDPRQKVILLVGGDKSGEWETWYEVAIPFADDLYDRYLAELHNKGLI